ncbi:MAG TPA: endonuclease/exonuclease/phosphatase family protein [Chthoniobacterales bacterium]
MSETTRPELRVATYNVHGCVGTDRRRSEKRIAQVIAELAVDLVGLQELDRRRMRSGEVDQAGVIAAELGWHYHFQAAMQHPDGHYGHALLSRYPMCAQRSACLPGVAPFFCRETRAAVHLEVATDVGLVQVINTHLGLGRRERRLQAELLTSAEWLAAAADGPLILLGDFNSLPGSRPHQNLSRHLRDVRLLVRQAGALRTFPTRFPLFAVDHIFVNEALEPRKVEVHRSPLARSASDHFPLLAELLVVAGA